MVVDGVFWFSAGARFFPGELVEEEDEENISWCSRFLASFVNGKKQKLKGPFSVKNGSSSRRVLFVFSGFC